MKTSSKIKGNIYPLVNVYHGLRSYEIKFLSFPLKTLAELSFIQ